VASELHGNDFNLLTKGDNNPVDDRGLYEANQMWLNRKHVIGRARGFLPYVGMITIFMNEWPWAKHVLILALGVFVILSKE
jgi:signal peptidase I